MEVLSMLRFMFVSLLFVAVVGCVSRGIVGARAGRPPARHHVYWSGGRCDWRWHGRYCRAFVRSHPGRLRSGGPGRVAGSSGPGERRVWALLTGYCATGRPAADGTWPYYGEAAAGPSYRFGTRLLVPGYGPAVVHDRGGAVGDGHFDLFFPSCSSAVWWGVRWAWVLVYG